MKSMDKLIKRRSMFKSKHPPVTDAISGGSSYLKPGKGSLSKMFNNDD